ncbi:hypothetical protein N0V88_001666 [Collariella sp. IMI 366227]|nr:hypothetical protein N0V88_001666 [Collariella sp. IMI 366227]
MGYGLPMMAVIMTTVSPLARLPLGKPTTTTWRALLLQTLGITILLSCWNHLLTLPMALADCECGYLSSIGNASDPQDDALFTDLLETDFTRPNTLDWSLDRDWARQEFNLTKTRARGDYGEMFAVDNVEYQNPGSREEGDGRRRFTSEGLKLFVRSEIVDGMVPVAELASRRLDIFYGTFRASIKYFNDTQEIDLEFLTKDFHPATSHYPINLVLQSRQSLLHGHDASRTPTFTTLLLPFNPTDSFHEYRIEPRGRRADWW